MDAIIKLLSEAERFVDVLLSLAVFVTYLIRTHVKNNNKFKDLEDKFAELETYHARRITLLLDSLSSVEKNTEVLDQKFNEVNDIMIENDLTLTEPYTVDDMNKEVKKVEGENKLVR